MKLGDAEPEPFVPKCTRCGYALLGLREPRCPECGESFRWGDLQPPDDLQQTLQWQAKVERTKLLVGGTLLGLSIAAILWRAQSLTMFYICSVPLIALSAGLLMLVYAGSAGLPNVLAGLGVTWLGFAIIFWLMV